jgi:hypothetical protein
MVVDQSFDHLFVLANFLEMNQFLAVELMHLEKILVAQALDFYAQALDLHLLQSFIRHEGINID